MSLGTERERGESARYIFIRTTNVRLSRKVRREETATSHILMTGQMCKREIEMESSAYFSTTDLDRAL